MSEGIGGTQIKPCITGCKSEYQDEHYGKGQRVQNNAAQGKTRCTVCGQLQ